MNYQDRIVRDPLIVGGEPLFKGTRVTLKTVLASLAEGATTAEILADFPTLSEEDVRAAIAFAAGSAQEDMPLIETPIRRSMACQLHAAWSGACPQSTSITSPAPVMKAQRTVAPGCSARTAAW